MSLTFFASRPWIATIAIFCVAICMWQMATTQRQQTGGQDSEYARLTGAAGGAQKSPLPSPLDVVVRGLELGRTFFDRSNPNNLGLAWHIMYSMGRVTAGFLLAMIVAIPLGFLLGLVPYCGRALDPFIQILKPISPLAWMPLALYTLKDSGAAMIFIIFICAVWPMLINTAAGAAAVRTEWTNVSRVFGLRPIEHVRSVVLPASVPMILTGIRVSIGIAWFVIVAAEMVGAQSGIGYFIWNEWNNLQISSMIVAVVLIGLIGLALDLGLKKVGDTLSYRE
ncbi:ABC transporter permease [Tardiphaga sp. 71_E8_N1_1]|uniref:ABC transporter permease n=1 Tax=Tardiphaga sp. 71_E8_N1_1 TaxID=3240784 RepID=UPI003F8C76F2